MLRYMKIKTSITISKELLESIKIIAKKENRSVSQEIEKTLREKYMST